MYSNLDTEGPAFHENPGWQPWVFHKSGLFLGGDRGSDCTFSGIRQSNEPGSASGKQFGNPGRWLETCRPWVALRSGLTFPSPSNCYWVSHT